MVVATAASNGEPSAARPVCASASSSTRLHRLLHQLSVAQRTGARRATARRCRTSIGTRCIGKCASKVRSARSPDARATILRQSRPRKPRSRAWASEQSRPLASRDVLLQRVREIADAFWDRSGRDQRHVPRPPHWGGNRLWVDTIELWTEGAQPRPRPRGLARARCILQASTLHGRARGAAPASIPEPSTFDHFERRLAALFSVLVVGAGSLGGRGGGGGVSASEKIIPCPSRARRCPSTARSAR
jgi:hypothetical protein